VVLDNEGLVRPDQLHVAPRGAEVRGVPHRVQRRVLREPARRQRRRTAPGTPSDTSAPEVWVDYRCHAPSRFRRHRAASRRRALSCAASRR
jgi:hypothetical protein